MRLWSRALLLYGGPAHGGANEAVIDMLENIVESGQPLQSYIDRAKDKNSHFRLMGFGHRIYKKLRSAGKNYKHYLSSIAIRAQQGQHQ